MGSSSRNSVMKILIVWIGHGFISECVLHHFVGTSRITGAFVYASDAHSSCVCLVC